MPLSSSQLRPDIALKWYGLKIMCLTFTLIFSMIDILMNLAMYSDRQPYFCRFFKGKTAYAATKVGMTVLVHGLGMELKGTGMIFCQYTDKFFLKHFKPKQSILYMY